MQLWAYSDKFSQVVAACSAALTPESLDHSTATQASTDNLTELMHGGGSWFSGMIIGAWILLVASCVNGLISGLHKRGTQLLLAVLLAVVSIPLGYGMLSLGLESHVVKYGNSLSITETIHKVIEHDLLLAAFTTKPNAAEPEAIEHRDALSVWDIWFPTPLLKKLIACSDRTGISVSSSVRGAVARAMLTVQNQ